MRISSQASTDGITEQHFVLDEVPGVLWTSENAASVSDPAPLILLGHGGGRHKNAPEIAGLARQFVTGSGFAALALDVPGHGDRPMNDHYNRIATENEARIAAGEPVAPIIAEFQALVAKQTVPEWRAALDAVQGHLGAGPVGYWGISLGCGLGVPFIAAEPRVGAAVLGQSGAYASAEDAARITVPVRFLVQWDDERVPRDQALALFDAFGSPDKSLHAYSGGHGELPPSEPLDAQRFLSWHLAPAVV